MDAIGEFVCEAMPIGADVRAGVEASRVSGPVFGEEKVDSWSICEDKGNYRWQNPEMLDE